MKLTPKEKKKYSLPEKRDREILSKVKQLEKLNLGKADKTLVALIKTQLEKDWRKPLMQGLDKLLKKYEK